MNFEPILDNSLNFTRDTLLGDWTRWLVFVILGLPGAILPFVMGISDMKYGKDFRWELIPWDQVAMLVFLMLIASFFLSGYIVRVYRGSGTPPAFDNWPGLFMDGLRLVVVWFIWMLPAFIFLLLAFVILIVPAGSGSAAEMNPLIFVPVLVLLFAAIIAAFGAVILGTIGAIRYSRTGSIIEGVNYGEVLATIRRIGWWDYILAGIILCVIAVIFSIIVMVLGMIPYIGWVIVLVLSPIMTVLSARFLSQVYDAGVPPGPAA
jgi:hypothetical protein